MGKGNMGDMLRKRMGATQQASDLAASDEAYAKILQTPPPASDRTLCKLPLDKLTPFFTADIGFKPYPPDRLAALSEQLQEDGLLVRIIVRSIPDSDRYEILAGHNRVNAAKMAGWTEIPAEKVEADDARAIVIATSTNLIQRQGLSIVERVKAYKALLDAKNRNGQHHASETFGEIRQRYNARQLVAEFFNVSEHEIRKAVKLTSLIPELLDILENHPRQLNLACADLMADYDADTQTAFPEICTSHETRLSIAAMKLIVRKCPPPSADRSSILTAWQEAREETSGQAAAPRRISFDRRKFAPYLDRFGGEAELETLFLEFLKQRSG
ncbi:MAG: ParB N-terminal domain-containing protein [Abditibacteriota bacterium]|nr:ParB N-terminal domain-containing protein [Abditibacteriota bacterium]